MPIYEFYCPDCHMIFNFFSGRINTEKKPDCPKCNKRKLDRKMSTFSSPKNREETDEFPIPDMDEAKMEQAMNLFAKEAEHMDENDPRQAADMMRKLTDIAGIDMGPGMEEALSRMEAGEDPEQIEQEMGDLLEDEDIFNIKKKAYKPIKTPPPRVDDTMYYL